LDNPRVLEKLELERRYFDDLGIPHRLVIDSELPKNKVKNLVWFRNARLEDTGWDEYPDEIAEHGRRFAYDITKAPGAGTLAQFCANYDARTGARPGTGLLVARTLLWDRTLATDLSQPDLPATPVTMFRVAQEPILFVVEA
jgi:hypothetical protein